MKTDELLAITAIPSIVALGIVALATGHNGLVVGTILTAILTIAQLLVLRRMPRGSS